MLRRARDGLSRKSCSFATAICARRCGVGHIATHDEITDAAASAKLNQQAVSVRFVNAAFFVAGNWESDVHLRAR